MIEFIKTKKTYILALAVLFLFVSLSETTYSLFLKSNTTNEFNYNTGLLDLVFVEEEPIKLENAFPTRDSDAINNKAYTLTIKNTGSLAYLFDLKMLSDETADSIDYRYIKVKVNDYLPHTLYSTTNVIDSNVIIYPNDEITYKITIWLDSDTPNNELGKSFNAKVVATGKSIYKTIDASGANHPKLESGMIPVLYDAASDTWLVADKSNMNTAYTWYNYAESKWANSLTVNASEKRIYDITGHNNLDINNLTVDNGNVIIENNYVDLNITNFTDENISNILRVKFNDLKDNVYIIANGKVAYYYNPTNKTFIFKNDGNTVTSEPIDIEKNKWYIIGYTYDGNNLSFYVDGNKIASTTILGNVSSDSSFKLGTDSDAAKVSKITVGDVLFYNRILSDSEIHQNYRASMNLIKDGLVYGYREFMPMTASEHYLSVTPGTPVYAEDINSEFVWIPRYKYRVWNILGEEGTDSYDAYHQGIDIAFESLDTSSGTIYCANTACYLDNPNTVLVTNFDNNKYYTHPAFSTNDKELTGFWVSKYEMSVNTKNKAGSEALRNTSLTDFNNMISGNYHIIKNTDWGAIAYLSHSKYGVCHNNFCQELAENDTYLAGQNAKDSTTGNAYGVFDMSGSADEYTMGRIVDNVVETNEYDQYPLDGFILGDATRELINWFDTPSILDRENSWIIRENLFAYHTASENPSDNITTRYTIK